MATSYTSLLGLALPVTGELQGTWGDTVNNSITSLLDTAIAGTTTLSTDGDVTLSTTTGASNQARQAILLCTGARTAQRTITAPAQSKIYTVINATSGGFAVKLVGAGPTTGLTIPAGASAVVAWNGSDFIEVGANTIGSLIVNGNLSVNGNTTLGDAAGDSVTVNAGTTTFAQGTANGVAYLNGSKALTSGSLLTFDGTTLTAPVSVITANSVSNALRITQTGTGNALLVEDSANPDSTPVVIDASGVLVVGHTTPLVSGYDVQSITTDGASYVAQRYNAGPSGVFVRMDKSRGASIGTNAIVNIDDVMGTLQWRGDDGTEFIRAAEITAAVDGTPGAGDMPGRLVFSTTADGASTLTERMRIDSVGTSTFTGQAIINASGTSDALRITQTGTGNALLVEDAANPDSTPFVVDASGVIVAGYTTAALGLNTAAPIVQLHSSSPNTGNFALFQYNATPANSGGLVFNRSMSGVVGTNTTVASGDSFGRIRFAGYDGTAFIEGARINAEVDGTPGTNDMPGRLVFSTTADGASTPTERMRITSAGKTGFATSAPAATVHVAGNTILSNVNVLGASYDSVSFSVAAEDTSPTDVFFSPDGKKMFVLGATGDDVNEYVLSTPWLVSSATYRTNFSVSAQDTAPQSLFFRADGLKMYVLGATNDTVYQYSLATAWDIATATYDGISFSVAAQETAPLALTFKPDGLSMYVVGSTNDIVYQYTLSTAWNVSTASLLQSFSVTAQETNPTGIQFTGDGSRMFVLGSTGDDINVYNLTTPWDISTAAFVSVFSVVGQDTSPQGFYIRPDGTKMYIAGQTNDTIYQYTVPSIDIQLTGPTSTNGNLTVQQDLTVYGRVGVGTASPSVSLAISASDAMLIPAGATGSRPTGVAGYLRFNTTSSEFEGYNGSAWASVGGAAISNDTSTATNVYPLFASSTSGTASIVYTSNAKLLYKPSTGEFSASIPRASNGIFVNTQAIAANYTIAATDNGLSAGPVTVNSGITVTVSSGAVWTVV